MEVSLSVGRHVWRCIGLYRLASGSLRLVGLARHFLPQSV
jgi:hypothetical protein